MSFEILIRSVVSSGLMLSLSRTNGVAPGRICAVARGVAPEVMLSMLGVADSDPLGVRNGVERSVFGVAVASLLGVAPLKSELISGALEPPINGVST